MIEKEILDYAKSKGLGWIATGGGFDYIYQTYGVYEEPDADGEMDQKPIKQFVLGGTEDIAMSPETLDEPSFVQIYTRDECWQNGEVINFKTAREAMDFMAAPPLAFTKEVA